MSSMRIILVNTRVSRNTRLMIGKVRERATLLPSVTESIMDAMDKVAKLCLETLDELEDVRRANDLVNGVESKTENNYVQKSYNLLEVRTVEIFVMGI